MDLVVRIVRGGLLAAMFVFVALPPNSAARGQQAAGAPPTKFEPAASAPPLLDADLLKLPHSASNHDLDKLDLSRFRKDTPQFTLPDRIDLGDYKLRLDTSRDVVDFLPRALTDAPDLSDVIPPARSGKKRSRRMQNYFGLTFTAPTH